MTDLHDHIRGEVVSIRHSNYEERLSTWDKFVPLLNRIRQAMNCSNHEAAQLLGYGGATMFSEWRRRGVPILAINAAVGEGTIMEVFSCSYSSVPSFANFGVLAELGQRVEPTKAPSRFSFDELTAIFALLIGSQLDPNTRKALTKKLAMEMKDA